MMRSIHDVIYGPQSIDEPVLEAVLATAAMQRLCHVSQAGVSGLLGISPDFSRYEHSAGVMLLLRRLGASLKEQLAGLLHDISHTAFSHVADFVYSDHEISYHEKMWPEVVRRSDIPAILEAHGFSWEELAAESGEFLLLEQPAPLLCADRVDYFLRTLFPAGLGTQEEIAWLLAHLTTHEGIIVVEDLEAARWMAERYIRMDETMWSSPREVALYWVLAHTMRRAVEEGYLREEDWYQTDRALWKQLHHIPEPKIRKLLSYVQADTIIIPNHEKPDFVTRTKVRTIDPPVLQGGSRFALSTLDPTFAARRAAHIKARSQPMSLWVTRPHSVPAQSSSGQQ
ncbi:MAG: HD domain-containing protein [Ardenticatenales bacterium]|nr:HD domain-containing protein [Ardenticatenales bacterium]